MHKIAEVIMLIWRMLANGLTTLFGQISWRPPHWLLSVLRWLVQGCRALKRSPILLLSIILCLSAGTYGYLWWQNRPKPIPVAVTVTAPALTEFEKKRPPNPLLLSFNRSVAPLALVDKTINQGITLSPALEGRWRWINDRQLEFRPTSEWPIAQHINIDLDRSLVSPDTELTPWSLSFDTATFTATLKQTEFYQDPLDPALKQALVHVHFSHPVDVASLQARAHFTLHKPAEKAASGRALTFNVNVDPLKLNAHFRSEALAIPKDEQRVTFSLDEDVEAATSTARFPHPLRAEIRIPGLYSALQINDVQITSTPNTQTQHLDQLVIVTTSQPVNERNMAKAVQIWLLPEDNPQHKRPDPKTPYAWNTDEITDAVLKRSSLLTTTGLPAEQEYSTLQSLRFDATANRQLFIKISPPLQSFGGYQLAQPYYTVRSVPEPTQQKELHIMGEGSLLSLSGDKKIAIMARDVSGVSVELGRVLPTQLQHVISQNGGQFSQPDFSGNFSADNLSERFTLKYPLTDRTPGKSQYQAIDLGHYLHDAQGHEKRGIFLMTTRNYEPKHPPAGESTSEEEADAPLAFDVEDKRLILVTDLGIIAKTELDGAQWVFVQSVKTGKPQADADVEVIAKNGQPLLHGKTDANGKVRFPKFSGMEREHEPLYYWVKYQDDMSFLPIKREDRTLNFSRYEVGGAVNVTDAQQLTAYLFSDRGIYRPGDTFNIGVIVKTEAWTTPLQGLPLEAEILDPRGLTVKRLRLQLAAGGFNALSYQTQATAPTGNYSITLYTVKDQQLGSTHVKVEEFQPDRMKAVATFSKPATQGWVHPDDLKLLVDVQNLYGAPAEARQVEASISLKPVLPAFKRYRDYHFHDPRYAKEGIEETLSPLQTNASGQVTFSLDLQKYTRASYQLQARVRAFEAEGGRSVTTDASVMVSDMPFLIGYKTDGALDFVAKNALRTAHLLAIDPYLQALAAEHLSLELIERKVVSVLIKQADGTYRYESLPKEISVNKVPLTIAKTGFTLRLDSSTPGDYAYLLRNADGLLLSRIDYRVAGAGNVSRSLDRNAELQLTLNKTEYAPGETITLNIRAPYTGAGLITIEREKVFASTWFKTDTQATVQHITVPKEVKGNAYVTVQYTRAPESDEIFMSPLSYGVAPFKINLAEQTQALTLKVPERIKPGETLHMQLSSPEPARVVVFAVDEGILQVARYNDPDPLGYFFQKRQLAVETSQILDLILPEFKQLMHAAAPGGDGDNDAGASFLNPFKRKQDKPAVYWSGITEVTAEKAFTYTVPDTFNGSLRVMAVAVNDHRIGSITQKTQVRGDVILSPNAPLMIAPGDEFSVSVAVANHVAESGANAPVTVSLSTPPHLSIVGAAPQTLHIAENHEAAAVFRVKAASGTQAVLGNASLTFSAKAGAASATVHSTLSIRPAMPKRSSLRFGSFRHRQDLSLDRLLYPELRNVSVGISPLPLVALPGLTHYLDNFEHRCTEQLISKAVPLLVINKHPEFASEANSNGTDASIAEVIAVLRTRQNAEGGFGLWHASAQAHAFASTYALHFLSEVRDSGLAVPEDMFQQGIRYLQTLAASPATDLYGLRTRAYAAYLLTRQGLVTTAQLSAIRETLRNRYKDSEWQNDLSAVYLAASYQLLQQHKLADTLINAPVTQLGKNTGDYAFEEYNDPVIHDAQLIAILARHFPTRAQKLSLETFQAIAASLQGNHYNTLSSAYLLLAYHAYLNVVSPHVASQLAISATDSAGNTQALPLPDHLAPRAAVPANTKTLHLSGPSGMPLYYALSESGYDQRLPDKPTGHGLEILRTYLNANGNAVDHINLGEELTVQIRIRATDRNAISNIAVQDTLPGGFEPVIPAQAAINPNDTAEADHDFARGQDRLRTGGNWQTDYVDIREDRVVLYGTVIQEVAEYQYKVKATSAGVFTLPPVYAESLYEREVNAYSNAGVIHVNEREQKPAAVQ